MNLKEDKFNFEGTGTNKKHFDRLACILHMISLLASGDYITRDEITEKLDITTRTFQRDLKAMRDAGFYVHYVRGKGYLLGNDFILPSLRLQINESLAVILMAQAAESNLPQPLLGSTRSALEKLIKTLPFETIEDFNVLRKRMSAKGTGIALVNTDREHFGLIQEAMISNLICQCEYDSIDDGEEIHLLIEPYHLHFSKRRWYLIGYSHLHQEVRTFSLYRFKYLKIVMKPFTMPKSFNIDNYLRNAWQLIRGKESHIVELEFSPKVGRNVAEVSWHQSQKTLMKEDGGCVLKFEVDGLDEIKWWILGYGDQVTVKRPAALRDMLVDTYRKALSNHEEEQV